MNGRQMLGSCPFDVSCHEGDPPRIVLAGEIDMLTTPTLDQAFDWIAEHRPSNVVVDVKSVSFLGSVGIGFLVRLATYLSPMGYAVEIASAGSYVRRVIDVCGLTTVFHIHDAA
jgi:anti-sigma B factor antagonist